MRSELEHSALVRRGATAVSERFAAETLVLDAANDRYVRLNDTGARLWALLEEPTPVSSLSEALARDWDIPPDRAEQDVKAFLESLASRGLVELTPP